VTEHTSQLPHIQSMTADGCPVQQQHGDVQAVAAGKLGVRVDIQHVDGRQRQGLPERRQLSEHFIAQAAAVAMEQCKTLGQGAAQRRGGAWRESPPPDAEDLTEFAMDRTVSGGTSPTTVTLAPSTMVENADEDPTRAMPVVGAGF
jgi:hypothetical protein